MRLGEQMTLLLPWKKITKTDLKTWSPAWGSSRGSSISACLRKTFPLQARHSIFSKAGRRSLRMTPATKPSWRPPPAPPSSWGGRPATGALALWATRAPPSPPTSSISSKPKLSLPIWLVERPRTTILQSSSNICRQLPGGLQLRGRQYVQSCTFYQVYVGEKYFQAQFS